MNGGGVGKGRDGLWIWYMYRKLYKAWEAKGKKRGQMYLHGLGVFWLEWSTYTMRDTCGILLFIVRATVANTGE